MGPHYLQQSSVDTITGWQHTLFNDLANDVRNGIRLNTLDEHMNINYRAMLKGGVPRRCARFYIQIARNQLDGWGVVAPTHIPWN
jgi:hypothetical protein